MAPGSHLTMADTTRRTDGVEKSQSVKPDDSSIIDDSFPPLKCTHCGHDVADSDAFCIYCGAQLGENLEPTKMDSSDTGNSSIPSDEKTAHSNNTNAEQQAEHSTATASLISTDNNKNTPTKTPLINKCENRDVPLELEMLASSISMEDCESNSFLGSSFASLEQLWVPDNFSNSCMDCQVPFGFPKPRRHHCRVCGLLFCRNCLQTKLTVPKSFGYGDNKKRCCRACVTALQVKSIQSPADVFAQRKVAQRRERQPSNASQNDNPYQVLGVAKDASIAEITQQYQSIKTIEKNQQTLQKAHDAYQTLQDPVRRQEHDAGIELSHTSGARESVQLTSVESNRNDHSECQVCFRPFKFGRRQYHCRRCTRTVCNNCSEGMKPIPELGFQQPVRHCSGCLTNPPKFIQPIMDPITKPPAGFEYLTRMDIKISVSPNTLTKEEGFNVNTYCVPNEATLKAINYTLTETERAIVRDYNIIQTRSPSDFEWLLSTLGSSSNIKALPNFPDRRTLRNEREQAAKALEEFLFGCLLHPLLRDIDGLKAFLVLPSNELKKYRSGSKPLYDSDRYKNVMTALRLEFERSQVRKKIDAIKSRQKAHEQRMDQQKNRLNQQKLREDSQNVRRDQASVRFKALETRKVSQMERMQREKDRYMKQSEASHILYFDTAQDASMRQQEEENREKEKLEFLRSKDSFQKDTTEWNENMALWSKHRANWSEHQHPGVSKDVANEWILNFYGIYHSKVAEGDANLKDHQADDHVPKELIQLHAELKELQETEPVFLDEEGVAVDEEWLKLAKEREHWASDRANMKKEDEMCKDEDIRYHQEHEFVAEEGKLRDVKIGIIEKDLEILHDQILSRHKVIQQRRQRHQALDIEFEKDWKVQLNERKNATKIRLNAHQNRIHSANKRCELFTDQLQRQQKSERILLFKRLALLEERKMHSQMFEEHQEDCRAALEVCQNARTVTPEYINRLDADMRNRFEELRSVMESNQPTPQEGSTSDVDERDEFMNQVRLRREEFDKELKEQNQALEQEGVLCTSLLTRMNDYQGSLEEEIEDNTIEDSLIANFVVLMEKEQQLLKEEKEVREQKMKRIHERIKDTGSWVMEAIHEHSRRKKNEANRLVKQAVRAGELQKFVQRFTHRVIDQEERIMRQKQRIINCEHKIEMYKAAENWYEYVKELVSENVGAKDMSKMEAGRVERMEDLTLVADLQKQDEMDIKTVSGQLEISKQVNVLQEERRAIWAEIENIYSVQKAQEKDEDLMMTGQIRDLIQQLGEAFEMLSNRLLEESESLQHALTQLEDEIESIKTFMERMEREESALCVTEKSFLTKESQAHRSKSELIKQRANGLIDMYKTMLTEHEKYPSQVSSIDEQRSERSGPCTPRKAELEALKKLVKARNYYDARSCAEFSRKFKIDQEFKEVRHVLEWARKCLDMDIQKSQHWIDESRKDRKKIEAIRLKANEIDWTCDILSKIPALDQVQSKLEGNKTNQLAASSDRRQNGRQLVLESESSPIHPEEQWLVELIDLKRRISQMDKNALKSLHKLCDTAKKEEQEVSSQVQHLKLEKEYVLNSIRFIDQEEARAIRVANKTPARSRPHSSTHEESESEDVEASRSTHKSRTCSITLSGSKHSPRTKVTKVDESEIKTEEDTTDSVSTESGRPIRTTSIIASDLNLSNTVGVTCCAYI